MNILVVEDHPTVAEYLRNAALRAVPGAAVVVAGSLEAAFASMRERPAQLVTLDLGLPGSEGAESLLRFRQAYPDARVVVVSGEDERNAIRGCIALGAAGFIPKSAGPKEMVHALRTVAEGGRYIPPAPQEDAPGTPGRDTGTA